MTDAGLRERVERFFSQRNTMTLATAGELPWAASVFFVADAALSLYFVTDPKTRHGGDLVASGYAAAAINEDCDDWMTIAGAQLEGPVSQVEVSAREEVLDLYLTKFPAVAALVNSPADDQERLIGRRLAASPFFCLRPKRIRLIDNARGFGSKAELTLDGF